MLGKYLGADDGFNLKSTLKTAVKTTQTVDEILPTIETLATDYAKASPTINFLIDYWPVTITGLFLVIAGGSFAGSYFVMRKARRV